MSVRRVFTVTSDPTEDADPKSRPDRDSGDFFETPRTEFFEPLFEYEIQLKGPRVETPPSRTICWPQMYAETSEAR